MLLSWKWVDGNMDLPYITVDLTYITKQHFSWCTILSYIAGNQQFKNLHPIELQQKTWKYATYGSYGEAAYDL